MKVGIIGSTGLIGSRVIELLKNSYEFSEFNSSTGTDITNAESLKSLAESDSEWVVLLAAKTDVDGCELDKALGEQGDAWKINVVGSQNVASLCHKTGKKLIYVSTDFVFDGTNSEEELYSENDTPNPVNWYAHTKWKGEQAVQESGAEHVIVRLAYPYRAVLDKKKDFMRAIKSRLESGQPVMAVTDHLFTPTFIDDFVMALEVIISQDVRGIYHVVGNDVMTPYEAAQIIAQEFDLDSSLISSTTRAEYFKGKADRPFNLSLNNDKINALGVRMKTFQEGLQEVKKQINR
ncbi:MAG TPA: NAD(P)-dependent oxidoreductase [Candidatus Levybacteria bacterium]|nr:NAD(P)-dependent oxidoreductase [Candidatus Levybacteria bacterium]